MRIVFLFFIILINYNVYSNELNKYFFLQWDCKDVLLFEGEAFNKNTSFNSCLNFSFENNVDLKLKNEIYIDLNQYKFHFLILNQRYFQMRNLNMN